MVLLFGDADALGDEVEEDDAGPEVGLVFVTEILADRTEERVAVLLAVEDALDDPLREVRTVFVLGFAVVRVADDGDLLAVDRCEGVSLAL